MSERLPALVTRTEIEPIAQARLLGRGRTRRWLRPPVSDTLVELTPDLLRLAGRALRPRATDSAPVQLPGPGANGMTVSEVEIDLASPLVRRIVVRTTNAWSVTPEVALARPRKWHGGRLGLGAASLAGLAVLGISAVRRFQIGSAR